MTDTTQTARYLYRFGMEPAEIASFMSLPITDVEQATGADKPSRGRGALRRHDYSAVLEWIKVYCAQHGYPPTVREIGQGCGISSTSHVNYVLRQLVEQGSIERDAETSRGIRVLAK